MSSSGGGTAGVALVRAPMAPLLKEVLQIVSVVGFYFTVSISLVFFNKYVMQAYHFEFPLALTWYQQILSFVCLSLCGHFGKTYRPLSIIPPIEFKYQIAKQVASLTAIFVAMLAFNNLCLKYVEVWFYQVARSMTIVFSIAFSYYFLNATTSRPAMKACFVVTVGFLIGVLGKSGGDSGRGTEEGQFQMKVLGVVFGVSSSVFVALYGVYVKKKMIIFNHNEWHLMTYNTILSLFFLLPLVFISGEVWGVLDADVWNTAPLSFLVTATFTGILGFSVSIAMFMQIKFTSPLTNTISGTVKACLQTILSLLLWNSYVGLMGAIGVVLVIGGSGWYSLIRYQEMQRKKEVLPLHNDPQPATPPQSSNNPQPE
ncbi:GDP-fucose transporter 1 [Pelomyxa schiedti]|nr:GDP-fucose transporter 1 [Pelomyxa schiedti]